VLVLKRDSTGTIVLHGRGRDLVEIEKAMSFDREACTWKVAGEADMVRRSQERNAVLDAIKEASEPVGPRDIAGATGMRSANVRYLLAQLVKEGLIEKASYGKYRRASVSTVKV
jgi:predicted transcriptional regulator